MLDGQLEPGEIWSVIDSGSALEEGKKQDGDVRQHLCLLAAACSVDATALSGPG